MSWWSARRQPYAPTELSPRPRRPRMALIDRLRTVAITAIVTSVGWIAFGGGLMDRIGNLAVVRTTTSPAAVAPAAEGTAGNPAPRKAAPLHKTTAQPLPVAVGDYVLPVAGVRPSELSDTFTDARGGGTRVHEAIDIMAPRGRPVVAASSGMIEKLFNSSQGGLTIYVRSPDRRTITYYAHLDAYAPGLTENQQVRRGQPLGTVGFTGNADPAAPHLHFAIMQTTPEAAWWEPANAVNPYPVLTGRGR